MLSTSTSLSRSRYSGSKKNRGFTLVELLVVVSIMLIITSTLLLQQQKFNSATLMRTLAYNIALSIRQAHVYGTSVVGTDNSGTITFAAGYGIYIDKNTPDSYQFFADLNNNGSYDVGESQKTFNLGSGYTINNYCAINPSRSYCKVLPSYNSVRLGSLSIVFKRPNPDAQFLATNWSFSPINQSFSNIFLQVQGPGGDTRAVSVTTTGQISVCGANKTIPDC